MGSRLSLDKLPSLEGYTPKSLIVKNGYGINGMLEKGIKRYM